MREKVEQIVRSAGELLPKAAKAGVVVQEKEGIGNFVTDCDVAVQHFLQKALKELLPQAAFVGEEENLEPYRNEGACWIVDPIDGTANFLRGFGYSAVSVALVEDSRPVVGVVYNPFSGELFSAEQGGGAYLNGRPIHVSSRPLKKSLVSFGATSYKRDITDRMFRVLREVFDRCEDIRSFGSAALDICQVAAGRLDVFWELKLYPWDYAAAACILSEAGGRIGPVNGGELPYGTPSSVLAANSEAYSDMSALFRQE
ncbi:MAG: inositol monophosphatase family protein [Eubacteriales bacterium]|nr:inositol monophosphatase family protein [Eubacteriales bacterium]